MAEFFKRFNDRIWREVLKAVNAEPTVKFAYPTNRTVLSREAESAILGEERSKPDVGSPGN